VIGPDRIAITGIGATEQGEIPGQTANEIALRAAVAAIADAGIDKSAIDGLVTCQPPLSAERAGLDEDMGQLLGINPSFSSTRLPPGRDVGLGAPAAGTVRPPK
jgi:hypothetical protein